eukprot:scaffold15795_cov110-Isochrysis_galbana.AAC.4
MRPPGLCNAAGVGLVRVVVVEGVRTTPRRTPIGWRMDGERGGLANGWTGRGARAERELRGARAEGQWHWRSGEGLARHMA